MTVSQWLGTAWPLLYLGGLTLAVGVSSLVGRALEKKSEKFHGRG